MRRKMKIINWRKAAALGLAVVMTLSLAGCGKGDNQKTDPEQASGSVQTGVGGYVYVPEYVEVGKTAENENISDFHIYEGNMYYTVYKWDDETETGSQDFYRKSLNSDAEAEKIAFPGGQNRGVMNFIPDKDGSIYYFVSEYSETENGNKFFLIKYDAQGNQEFEQDISDIINKDENNSYVQYAAIDGEGRICASANDIMWLFDSQGTLQGTISISNWINDMGTGKDGKIYVTQYGNNGIELAEVDFTAKALGKTYENFPGNGSGSGLIQGIEKDFLVNDGSKLYEYDMATQEATVLLNWLDSDINGSYVQAISVLEDGRIAVIVRDWGGEQTTTEMAVLTKTEVSKVVQKENITVGTLYMDQMLQTAAVKFNKSNEKYHVNIKTYVDEQNWNENSYNDAITAMNNDLTSGNGPDILSLSALMADLDNYVSKGLLEDLGPYLDSSTVIKREDFLEPVLNAFVYDGIQVCIPTSFMLHTVVGRTSLVGDQMGWTLDEMIAFADQHTDKEIFSDVTKASILSYCFTYNQDSFIDQETGECHFDSEGFKKVLEFSNRFPKDFQYDENAKSSYAKVKDGDTLLMDLYISGIDDYAMNMELFGGDPVTAIGFPTLDGSVGCVMNASNGSYGMNAKSSHKEGAWAFLESTLSESGANRMFSNGLPTRKEKMEATIEEALQVTYVTDENGEPMLDEQGNQIRESKGGWSSNDFSVEYYGATQEQVDAIMALIDVAKPAAENDSQILNIVTEEAAPYFEGQKTLDEVVNIIQSRVQIYVSENS